MRQTWRSVYAWFVPPYRMLVVEECPPGELRHRTPYVVQEER